MCLYTKVVRFSRSATFPSWKVIPRGERSSVIVMTHTQVWPLRVITFYKRKSQSLYLGSQELGFAHALTRTQSVVLDPRVRDCTPAAKSSRRRRAKSEWAWR